MKLHQDGYLLLTGGAGFIGSCLLHELNQRGITRIIVVDDLAIPSVWQNLTKKKFSDLLHKDQLFSWLEGREAEIEAIIHLGACSSTIEGDANYLLENNYRYSRRLAEFALKNAVPFLYASSAATYGNGSQGFSDSHDLLESLEPLNMYGYSKHLFDLWALREGALPRMIGIKYFNVYGPNEYHKGRMASAITRMVPEVLEKGTITLFSSTDTTLFKDGEQSRDFIYVKDAVATTLDLWDREVGGIYNVGTGQASSWNQLARAVFKALNKPENIQYIPTPHDLIGKYQNFTQADTKKAIKVINRALCRYSLDEAVAEYVNKYLLERSYL